MKTINTRTAVLGMTLVASAGVTFPALAADAEKSFEVYGFAQLDT